MTITEYRRRVRELFEWGATDAQWDEMTQAVYAASERFEHEMTSAIDQAVGVKDAD